MIHHRFDQGRGRRWLALTAAVIMAGGVSFLLLPSAAALTGPAPSGTVRAEDGADPSGADQPAATEEPAPAASSAAAGDGGADGAAAPSKEAADQPSTDGQSDGSDDPNADDPNADDPNADDPNADDPNADDPNVDDPNADDPNADDPNADDPNASEDATDDPTDEASDGASDGLSDLASDLATSPAASDAGPQISIQGTPGTPIGAVTIAASGDGLAPSTPFEVVAYSVPQVIASGSADAQGAFSVSATLPADLAPGAHTVVFQGTGADGQSVESGVGFTVAPDGSLGEVTGPVDSATLANLVGSQTAPGASGAAASQAGAKSPAYAPVDPLDRPGAVVTTTIAALTLVTAVGAAAAGAAGGARGGGSQGGGSPGGGDAGGGVDAKVEDRRKRSSAGNSVDDRAGLDEDLDPTHNRGWRTKFQPRGTHRGDLSRTHRFPGTAFTDELSYVSILAVAPKSPLLARTIDDAGPWRAMIGSLSLAFPVAGIGLGIASAVNTGGIAQPPALALMIAFIAIGVLDALAGLLGVMAFAVGVAVSGGIVDISSVRTLMGIALLVLGPGLMASSFRDTRRPAARTSAQWWERVTDLVVVPLMGGWITLSVVDALPGLAGYAFPIADSAGILAVVVMAVLVLNVLLEEAAARWFPERMATVLPSERPEPGSVQMLISGLFRMGLFLFVSAAFVGNVWQLWVAAVLFTIPNLVRIVEDRLPNSPRLWQVLPMGLPQLGFLLIVSGIVAAAVASALGQTPQFAQMSFVILAVPGFILDGLGAFGREPDAGDRRWYCRPRMVLLYRIGGVAVLLATVWLALNV